MNVTFKENEVRPSGYTLQHGWNTSFYALRHWTFEGKKDGDWFIISTHHHEPPGPYPFRRQHQTCYFPVRGKFFAREFRVRQIGLNSGGYSDLYISAFEVYGKRRKASAFF